jgi:hypothetical protein
MQLKNCVGYLTKHLFAEEREGREKPRKYMNFPQRQT